MGARSDSRARGGGINGEGSTSLDALLKPKTYRLVPPAGTEQLLHVTAPCSLRSEGMVDLTLIGQAASEKNLSHLLSQEFNRARVIWVHPRFSASILAQNNLVTALASTRFPDEKVADAKKNIPLVLGPESGLWTPHLQIGIRGVPYRHRSSGRQYVIITQGRSLAEHCLSAAAKKKLHVLAAISTGYDSPTPWHAVALALQQYSPPPHLLLALHRPLDFEDLVRFSSAGSPSLLMLTGQAESIHLPTNIPQDIPQPRTSALAHALGLPVVHTPEELMEAVGLLEAGFIPKTGTLLTLADSDDEAALLESMLERVQLKERQLSRLDSFFTQKTKDTLPAITRNKLSSSGAVLILDHNASSIPVARAIWQERPYDGLITRLAGSAAGLGLLPTPNLELLSEKRKMIALTADTLAALSALLIPGSSLSTPTSRRPVGMKFGQACQLLDNWHSALSELQIKELIACYGLERPTEMIASSSSAASNAAARIGFPVAMKAVGPNLVQRKKLQAVVLDIPTAAAARQAFRDVIQACGQIQPPPPLEGVLVSSMIALPFSFDITLIWPPEFPPFLFVGRKPISGASFSPSFSWIFLCPLSKSLAENAAEQLLQGMDMTDIYSPGPAEITLLTDFLIRLSWLGPDLATRMYWLRLDTVSPPQASTPPLVIDGHGLQTESLRAPSYG